MDRSYTTVVAPVEMTTVMSVGHLHRAISSTAVMSRTDPTVVTRIRMIRSSTPADVGLGKIATAVPAGAITRTQSNHPATQSCRTDFSTVQTTVTTRKWTSAIGHPLAVQTIESSLTDFVPNGGRKSPFTGSCRLDATTQCAEILRAHLAVEETKLGRVAADTG